MSPFSSELSTVRIGVDMLGIQSHSSRVRGIGRYGRSLLAAILAIDCENNYFFYAHEGLSDDDFPQAANAAVRRLGVADDPGQAMDRLARSNPDDLDVLLLLSPFEIGANYDPPTKPLNGLTMAAVVYDLVPFLFQERYLTWPPAAARVYRSLERLRKYDALLAISDATRCDLERLTSLRDGQATSISGASDPEFFNPGPVTPESTELLIRLGIDRPFVFCLASMDWRKNLAGLLEAFHLLPRELRATHQLVVSCFLSPEDKDRVRSAAVEQGIADALVLTGQVSDTTLRELYRRCAVFAFPALYEGFGLPLLEAMHCGAPVVAGNNSSQVEVVGDAGLLVNAQDAGDLAAKLASVLQDRELAGALRTRGLERSKCFRWETTATLALEGLTRAVADKRQASRHRAHPAHKPPKARIAVVSPWPPKASGISDYAVRLVRELKRTHTVDLYHDGGYEPDLAHDQRDFGIYDHRLFDKMAAALGYLGVIYQMGNSHYHRFVYDAMARHPCVTTLHDFGLAGFHECYARLGTSNPDHFLSRLRHSHPEAATEAATSAARWADEEGGLPDACTRRGYWMSRDVFERSDRVVVHSPWCRYLVGSLYPEHFDKTAVIPLGASSRVVSPERRVEIRKRFGLPIGSLILGSFGIVHRNKLSVETVEAFAELDHAQNSALLIFVGQDLMSGETLERARELGIGDRVRMLGRQSLEDFEDLIGSVDIGVCLRRPPTSGESSAALLDLLRHGIPTIVSEVGTFGDYPRHVVRKVPRDAIHAKGIAGAMIELARGRAELGSAAMRHVEQSHKWSDVAARYVEEVERAFAERGTVRGRIPRSATLSV
jgi:glycosyltransferase involved in cell wall biosynthesis